MHPLFSARVPMVMRLIPPRPRQTREPHTYRVESLLDRVATLPVEYWSGRRESNPRHLDWKSNALPTELLPQSWRSQRDSNP